MVRAKMTRAAAVAMTCLSAALCCWTTSAVLAQEDWKPFTDTLRNRPPRAASQSDAARPPPLPPMNGHDDRSRDMVAPGGSHYPGTAPPLSAGRPMSDLVIRPAPTFDVSYSGLKTAASQAAQRFPGRVADIAASFQRAAITQLRRNVERALVEFRPATLGLCGGVAANSALREAMQDAAQRGGVDFVVPPHVLCTDNAAMIAAAGYYRWRMRADKTYSTAMLDFEAHSILPVA